MAIASLDISDHKISETLHVPTSLEHSLEEAVTQKRKGKNGESVGAVFQIEESLHAVKRNGRKELVLRLEAWER